MIRIARRLGVLGVAALALAACGGSNGSVETSTGARGNDAPSSAASTAASGAGSTAAPNAGSTAAPSAGSTAAGVTTAALSPAVRAVRTAATKAAEVSSVSYTTRVESSGIKEIPGGKLTFTAEGKADFANKRSQFTMDMTELYKSAAGSEGAALKNLFADGKIEVITDGNTAYMKFAILDLLLGADPSRPWVKLPETATRGAGSPFGYSDFDPTATLELLAAAGSVTESSGPTIDGVSTTKYAGTIDMKTALATLNAEDRKRVEESLGSLGSTGLGTIDKAPVEMYVGSDGWLRRVVMTIASPTGDLKTTTDYSGFGKPVNITVPGPNQVRDGSKIFGGSTGS